MDEIAKKQHPAPNMVTFYHDIEQDIDSEAEPEKCRAIVKKYLELEKKYNVPATYNVVGKLFKEQPDLIGWILDASQEIAFHSYNHQSDWQSKYFTSEIGLCRNTSQSVKGYRSPQSLWNHATLKSLYKKGFLWNAEVDAHKEPYFIYKGLVRLPIAGDDWGLHKEGVDVDRWVQQFSRLLKTRHYFGFGTHDSVTSFAPEEMLKAYERILQIAVENKALLVTFSEAADLFRRASVSRFYSKTAKSWNIGAKGIGLTKNLQKRVRAEAEKLQHPVVADLGSGGGLLSSPLKDIAKKVYCVDNAPGMVSDVRSGDNVEARFGEVTDSNLPDNSCDMVICSRIIEYLLFRDHLADEIKRIGKIGATYFITFPVLHENIPPHGGSPPRRIRHYFTSDEIQEWTKQIGPGQLVRDKDDWIFVGKIEKEYSQNHHKRTIPMSAFRFRFPSPHYHRIKSYLEIYVDNIGRRFPKSVQRLGKLVLSR